MGFFTTKNIEKIRKLKIELAGLESEHEQLTKVCHAITEGGSSFFRDLVKTSKKIGEIKKEIELLEGSC